MVTGWGEKKENLLLTKSCTPEVGCVPGDPSCIEVGAKVDRMNPGSLAKCSPEPRNFLKLEDQLPGLSVKMFWGICFGWRRLETRVNSRKVSTRPICLNAFQEGLWKEMAKE